MIDTASKKKFCGVFYCSVWYISILFGFYFLYAPLLPLLILHRKLYRKFTDILFTAWESFNVSLLEIFMKCQIYIAGDLIRPEENSLIILNHRTRVDWNFFWAALLHGTHPPAHNAKLVLKDEIKAIPGVGWTMQMARFAYICRKWEKDEKRFNEILTYLGNHSLSTGSPYQMILFPEGTNFTSATKKKSLKYGEANNLKPLNHLLHPRTTGFTYIVQKMRENGGLHAVYDVTLGYPDMVPETEQDLMDGNFPNEVHFHIKRHPISTLPTTYIGLEKWLQELWREKDQILDNFYTEKIRMPMSSNRQGLPQTIWPLQYVSLFSWFAFILKMLHTLLLTWAPWHWLWIIVTSIFMTLISKYTDGLQMIETQLDNGISLSQLVSSIFNLIKGKRD